MMRVLRGLALIVVSACSTLAAAAVIDHTCVDTYAALPQTVIDQAVAGQKVYFSHASVGENISWGISDLHSTNPTRFPWASQSADGNLPAGGVQPNTVYEYYRGNIGWTAKVNTFATYLANGWGTSATIVINKLCFVDADADWQQYAVANANGTALAQLEPLYPNTKFVYCTAPVVDLARNPDMAADMLAIQQFNQGLRAWAVANNKLLYDIADIESHDPSGTPITYDYNGQLIESMYPAYGHPDDGKHLSLLGYDRVATGMYLIPVAALPEPATALLLAGVSLTMLSRRQRRRA